MRFSASATADTRYSFTGQYLEAAAMFVRRARLIENDPSLAVGEGAQCEHRGLITAAIMQCAAALETESHEICVFGPGAHLGSNGIDQAAQQFLAPLAELIDKQSTLSRYVLILHLLKRRSLVQDAEPYRSAALVVRLRNELIHYKSLWGAEMTAAKLFSALKQLRHRSPSFTSSNMNFFPHLCLSADCGTWAVTSSVAFLEAVYAALGIPSRFDSYRGRLIT